MSYMRRPGWCVMFVWEQDFSFQRCFEAVHQAQGLSETLKIKLQITNYKLQILTFVGSYHELPCVGILGPGGDIPEEDQWWDGEQSPVGQGQGEEIWM